MSRLQRTPTAVKCVFGVTLLFGCSVRSGSAPESVLGTAGSDASGAGGNAGHGNNATPGGGAAAQGDAGATASQAGAALGGAGSGGTPQGGSGSANIADAGTIAADAAPISLDNGKLKIFILAGQSNMEGYGKVDLGGNPDTEDRTPNVIAGLGSLRAMVQREPERYASLIDPLAPISYPDFTGDVSYPGWVTRPDVWVSYWDEEGPGTTVERRNGALSVGFGAGFGLPEGYIGPEYGFGHVVGDAMNDPILLIKTAWGGKSLAVDFRPPRSGGTTGPYYLEMVSRVHQVLNDVLGYYPGYDGAGYELAGFAWHQGWNDRVNADYVAEYEANLTNLILDLRDEFAAPALPVVIANTGMADADQDNTAALLLAAQANVSDAAKHPEFSGTVGTVDTRPFDYGADSPAPTFGFHWNYNGESYFHIGESMGAKMIELLSP